MLFEKGPSCWSGAGYAGCEAYLDLRQSNDFTLLTTVLLTFAPQNGGYLPLFSDKHPPQDCIPKENDPKTQTPARSHLGANQMLLLQLTI